MSPQKVMVDLVNSDRAPLEGARRIGAADPTKRIEVSIIVRRRTDTRAFPAVAELGARLPKQRQHLSRAEFARTHGGHPEDIAKIRAFASEHGLEVKSESIPRRTVVLAGTVQAFCRAFDVELSEYEHPDGGRYRGRTGRLRIPGDLAETIEGVFGLDNRPQAKPHIRIRKEKSRAAQPRAIGQSYDPPSVAQAYDFPVNLNGSGQCVAILELGGGYQNSDLQQFFRNLSIPVPKVAAISVDGARNAPTVDQNADGEVALDIEVAGAVAPGAQIAVYFAPNTDQGFLDALTTAIHDTNFSPSVISISWGGPESTWTQQAMSAFDAACQDAPTVGVTVLAAAGDNGATDGAPGGQLTVDFPASSPAVTGCGGTKLVASGSTVTDEEVWNELAQNEGATGGGISAVFPIPTWQANANVPAGPTGFAGRGVPDVAGDADPTTGYNIVVGGQSVVIGGTSAVAPLWAGLLVLLNQSLGRVVGYLNPLLYTPNVSQSLNDITIGQTDGYQAAAGWDPCTGWGSPDGAKLLAAIGGQAAAAAN